MVLRLFGLKDSDLKARPTRTASPGNPSGAPLIAIRRPVTRDAGTSRAKPASAKQAGRAAKRKTAAPRRRATR